MAFDPRQISPIDFKKGTAVGIDIPFNAPGVFRSNYTTAASTKNNLINYFLTNKGERPLNPTFGGGLREFIFQQITTDNLDFLKDQLQNDISNIFPNVIVNNLDVLRQTETNTITVSLTYRVANTNITDTLLIDFT